MYSHSLISVSLLFVFCLAERYEPTWESLDRRPIPLWYDDAKFGIFMHWGVYSVLGHGEWFIKRWYDKDPDALKVVDKYLKNGTTYADLGQQFTAIDFQPDEFARIVKSSGARYFVFTTKHHDGYALWPSEYAYNWNSVSVGPHRDIVGELRTAFDKAKITYGLYFSLLEFVHPLYLKDLKMKNTSYFVDSVMTPQIYELVNKYKPDIVWSDGDWDFTPEYWRAQQFLAWLYNDSPVKDRVVVNDRWGFGTYGKHGSFINLQDDFRPDYIVNRKYETCTTVDGSWSYRRMYNLSSTHSAQTLIRLLIRTVAYGGNLLLDIAPDANGKIPIIQEERLAQIGKFVDPNSEAIFGTKPWIYQNETKGNVWYTSKIVKDAGLNPRRLWNPQREDITRIYAFILNYGPENSVLLRNVKSTPKTRITLLGTKLKINFKSISEGLRVDMPFFRDVPYPVIPVLKIEFAADDKHTPDIRPPK